MKLLQVISFLEHVNLNRWKWNIFAIPVKLDSGRQLDIIPGMEAQVDIIVGKRSALDYLLVPLKRLGMESLREK